MPKIPHEAVVQLVRNAPGAVLRLLWPELPEGVSIALEPGEFVDLNLPEVRADSVVAVGGRPERPDEVFVVEAQIEWDAEKAIVWPVYVAGARSRYRCSVTLVVVALDPAVAERCAREIDLGRRRCTLRPVVLGPAQIPRIVDLAAARASPELAVLSVAAHADEPGINTSPTPP